MNGISVTAAFTDTYDLVGNRLTHSAMPTTTLVTTVYKYDIANRLTNVGGQAYTCDNNDNLLFDDAFNYAYDTANRLTEVRPFHGIGY